MSAPQQKTPYDHGIRKFMQSFDSYLVTRVVALACSAHPREPRALPDDARQAEIRQTEIRQTETRHADDAVPRARGARRGADRLSRPE